MSDEYRFYTVKSRISRAKIHEKSYAPDDIVILGEKIMDIDEYEDRFEPVIDLLYDLLSGEGKFD